jgi:hypothetical protein
MATHEPAAAYIAHLLLLKTWLQLWSVRSYIATHIKVAVHNKTQLACCVSTGVSRKRSLQKKLHYAVDGCLAPVHLPVAPHEKLPLTDRHHRLFKHRKFKVQSLIVRADN